MPDLKLYTIHDLREWLINNNPPVGLNEHVIAPVRAYAILNNPYVKEDDTVVATIYEGEELAAFTAAFPEITNHQLPITNSESDKLPITNYKSNRIWWASTLWCNPKFQGKGYGLIVIGSLMEAHDGEVTLDRWGAKETVEIFKCLGYDTIYTPRYHFSDKTINRSTLKGKIAYIMQECIKCLHRCIYQSPITNHKSPITNHQSQITNHKYLLKYSTFVDGEAYAFIQAHRGNDLFLREQKMLNWILRYPFKQSCIVFNRIENDTEFTSNSLEYNYWVVKIYQEDRLVGVYILRKNSAQLSVVYIYYEEEKKEIVFVSIVGHIIKLKTRAFATENKDLADYVKKHLYFPKKSVEHVSFSVSQSTPLPNNYTMQLGDGDSFA